jgi:hypothetical protein
MTKGKRSRPVRGLLTLKKIAKVSKPGRHLDAHNLYLQVGPSGTKSWLLRYARDGREHWMGLGPLYDTGLEAAREKARQARLLLRDGIDPLQARRSYIANNRRAESERDAAEARLKTFAECATEQLPEGCSSNVRGSRFAGDPERLQPRDCLPARRSGVRQHRAITTHIQTRQRCGRPFPGRSRVHLWPGRLLTY